MAQWRRITNEATGAVILGRAKLAVNFWQHFRGLMLAPPLSDDEGMLFVTRKDNRTDTTIHMFFMRYPIGVVWVNNAGKVVDKQLAKPWRPYYAPAAPARYFIEANSSILERVAVGDTLRFEALD